MARPSPTDRITNKAVLVPINAILYQVFNLFVCNIGFF